MAKDVDYSKVISLLDANPSTRHLATESVPLLYHRIPHPDDSAQNELEELEHLASVWSRPRVQDAVWDAVHVAASVCLILANKAVLEHFNFRFPVTVTWIHSAIALVGVQIMAGLGALQVKRVAPHRALPLAAACATDSALAVSSLALNSLPLFIALRLVCAPVEDVVERVLCIAAGNGISLPPLPILPLAVLVLGVLVSCFSEATSPLWAVGLLLGALSAMFSALYQVWMKREQRSLGASVLQLRHQSVPYIVAVLAVATVLSEPLAALASSQLSVPLIAALAAGGVLTVVLTAAAPREPAAPPGLPGRLAPDLDLGDEDPVPGPAAVPSGLGWAVRRVGGEVAVGMALLVVGGEPLGLPRKAGLGIALVGEAWYALTQAMRGEGLQC